MSIAYKEGEVVLVEARTQKDRGPFKAIVEKATKSYQGRYGGGAFVLHIRWLEGPRAGKAKRWVPVSWVLGEED